MKQRQLQPKFAEFIPETLEDGILYVAMEYQMVAHLCCCGCGAPVYLPLSPVQWRLTFDGEAIWMDPSIGNWSLPCRSHYWIRGNNVQWAEQWTQQQVKTARELGRRQREAQGTSIIPAAEATQVQLVQRQGIWARIRAFFRRRGCP